MRRGLLDRRVILHLRRCVVLHYDIHDSHAHFVLFLFCWARGVVIYAFASSRLYGAMLKDTCIHTSMFTSNCSTPISSYLTQIQGLRRVRAHLELSVRRLWSKNLKDVSNHHGDAADGKSSGRAWP